LKNQENQKLEKLENLENQKQKKNREGWEKDLKELVPKKSPHKTHDSVLKEEKKASKQSDKRIKKIFGEDDTKKEETKKIRKKRIKIRK